MQKSALISMLLAMMLPATFAQAQSTYSSFSTTKFDYKIPQKVMDICKQRNDKLPTDEYLQKSCMEVDIDIIKTTYPWIDSIVNDGYKDTVQLQQTRKGIDEQADEVYQMLQDKENEQLNLYQISRKITLLSTSPRLIQIRQEDYEYTGGAHGMPSNSFYVFDMAQQKQLALDDILVNPAKKKALEKLGFAQFKNFVKKDYERYGEVLTEAEFADHQKTWQYELTDNFYFTPKGLTLSYDPYALGPYSMGFFILNIDKKDLKGIVKDEYLNQHFDKFDDDKWSEE